MRIYGLLAGGFAATLFCATGCFGDNSDGPGPSGSLSISNVEAPTAGVDAEGSRTPIHVHVKGKRDEQLSVAVTSTLGIFSPEQAVVITDSEGVGTFSTEFVSGSDGGDAVAVANVANLSGDSVSFDFTFPVVPFTRVGEVAQLPNPSTIFSGFFEGQSIDLPVAGKLRKVGLVVQSVGGGTGAGDVVVGIYSDVSGAPRSLLAAASGKLVAGVNELTVPEVMLPAGTYWFMMELRTSTTVLYRNDAKPRPLKFFSPLMFSTTPPPIYPAHRQQDEPQRNVYLVLGR